MKKEVAVLAKYRFERARETRKEAEILLSQEQINGAMNRIYYSLFYAVKALLATKELDSSKHEGVISLFHKEFVKTGKFS
ncbi:MAG: HEPN domain-containing protein, partial [Candidatus Omnitrophica bacterium]|nr:HEPN domain-containing protein [Candidatus Omnitrophota bacterium]